VEKNNRIYIRPERVDKERLSRQDKCLIRNDKSMLLALDTSRLDTRSLSWLKYGK